MNTLDRKEDGGKMQIEFIKRPWNKSSGNRPNTSNYYQSKEWKDLVDFIWKRDNGICQLCKEKGIIHCLVRGTKDLSKQGTVDHKYQRKSGGSDNPDNLWLIGSNHHQSKSADEGNKMR